MPFFYRFQITSLLIKKVAVWHFSLKIFKITDHPDFPTTCLGYIFMLRTAQHYASSKSLSFTMALHIRVKSLSSCAIRSSFKLLSFISWMFNFSCDSHNSFSFFSLSISKLMQSNAHTTSKINNLNDLFYKC